MYYDICEKRPLGPQTEARIARKNKVIIHTMVGTLAGTDSMFRAGGYTGTESHFGTGPNGEKWQWQDDEFEADAQLEGNDDCISIENADFGAPYPSWDTNGSNVPEFTSAQIKAIVAICTVVCRRHNIPARLIPDTEDATRGIGYHRQGIDPFRKHGERYSDSTGKVCPGDNRVRQIRNIIIPRVAANLTSPESLREPDMTPGEVRDIAREIVRDESNRIAARAASNHLTRGMRALGWTILKKWPKIEGDKDNA